MVRQKLKAFHIITLPVVGNEGRVKFDDRADYQYTQYQVKEPAKR